MLIFPLIMLLWCGTALIHPHWVDSLVTICWRGPVLPTEIKIFLPSWLHAARAIINLPLRAACGVGFKRTLQHRVWIPPQMKIVPILSLVQTSLSDSEELEEMEQLRKEHIEALREMKKLQVKYCCHVHSYQPRVLTPTSCLFFFCAHCWRVDAHVCIIFCRLAVDPAGESQQITYDQIQLGVDTSKFRPHIRISDEVRSQIRSD